MWITNSGFADILITFAQVDGDKFTCFVIDANSEGFNTGEEENKKMYWEKLVKDIISLLIFLTLADLNCVR
jgi:alkylation response protein AidB-like acyl-CoA dehydrogenase